MTATTADLAPAGQGVCARARNLTLALLTITYFFSYMDRQILAILLEDIKADLLLNDTQLGFCQGLPLPSSTQRSASLLPRLPTG